MRCLEQQNWIPSHSFFDDLLFVVVAPNSMMTWIALLSYHITSLYWLHDWCHLNNAPPLPKRKSAWDLRQDKRRDTVKWRQSILIWISLGLSLSFSLFLSLSPSPSLSVSLSLHLSHSLSLSISLSLSLCNAHHWLLCMWFCCAHSHISLGPSGEALTLLPCFHLWHTHVVCGHRNHSSLQEVMANQGLNNAPFPCKYIQFIPPPGHSLSRYITGYQISHIVKAIPNSAAIVSLGGKCAKAPRRMRPGSPTLLPQRRPDITGTHTFARENKKATVYPSAFHLTCGTVALMSSSCHVTTAT